MKMIFLGMFLGIALVILCVAVAKWIRWSRNRRKKEEVLPEIPDLKSMMPNSFPLFEAWLNKPCHDGYIIDGDNWFPFVISLSNHQEIIGGMTLAEYLQRQCNWDEFEAETYGLKLQEHLTLIELVKEDMRKQKAG
jgi:hypothetical protein